MDARAQERPAGSTGRPGPAGPGAPKQNRPIWFSGLRYAAASAALLIPCFWQERIQAGDLGSHIYNAWLAELIRRGQAPGLSLAAQATNVLFDLLLGALFRAVGAAAAERIAVGLAVLVLVWGAFAFLAAAARRSWALLPVLAILAYGWVFHMGFFNFYLSLGLCFWALALAWNLAPRRVLAAVPILALAYTAHGLPVAWACAVVVYLWIARRLPEKRGHLLLTALVALVAAHIAMTATGRTIWNVRQVQSVAGADQAWVYDDKYLAIASGLLVLMAAMIAEGILRHGARRVTGGRLLDVFALSAAGAFLLPSFVWLPGYERALLFIAERMSLALGVVMAALAATDAARRWHAWAAGALAAAFFLFLYTDERALNGLERRIAAAAKQLPLGARVVTNAHVNLRVNTLSHMLDRACIGRCYSYANYEAPSGQFRIRVTGPTPIVEPTGAQALHMEKGEAPVEARELPLYRISIAPGGTEVMVDSMRAGERVGISEWKGWRERR